MSPPDRVVLVHGLWMSGMEMTFLRQRLEHEHGFDAHIYSYPTMHGDVAQICRDLARFAGERATAQGRVHFVGHSLGGAIIYRTLTEQTIPGAGNVVLLGSPLNGSRAAAAVAHYPFLKPILGPHVLTEFAQPPRRTWTGPGAIGAIAGSKRLGTGQFFTEFTGDHDGSVAVSETLIPGLADHLVLPHSHMGMIFAADVASHVAHFLRHGRFAK